ncbi:hypothetical protein lbkm_2607 [Lachnospiraceae bacterium KM106-2]|nr:hypothetical protein lbkm_2607 [Lachnospiraceae bacterium KM106-2]
MNLPIISRGFWGKVACFCCAGCGACGPTAGLVSAASGVALFD